MRDAEKRHSMSTLVFPSEHHVMGSGIDEAANRAVQWTSSLKGSSMSETKTSEKRIDYS